MTAEDAWYELAKIIVEALAFGGVVTLVGVAVVLWVTR